MKNKNLINSFKYAFSGIKEGIKGERNIKIDICIAILVVVFGFILKINYIEWIICISWIALVIGAELFNTAIETTVNIAMPNIDKSAKKAKDVSAGGVLVFAIGSFIIGIIIFLPKILLLFK